VSEAFGDCACNSPTLKTIASIPTRADILRMLPASQSRIGSFVYMYEPQHCAVPERAKVIQSETHL
jgi:hypothetical protein